jgi:GTP-binding protein YchF
MAFSIGIVGLPNVGKSTLFETITRKQVDRANYPFCTIDPNVGVVAVPDERVDALAKLTNSAKKIYTTVEFVDIAGLIKGAAEGEGLGNKFLANIRECDAIVYVLRAFKNADIINTQEALDPIGDKMILDTELSLKDLDTLNKRLDGLARDIRGGKPDAQKDDSAVHKAIQILNSGKILFGSSDLSEEDIKFLGQYQLLTLKPRIYLLNGKDEEVDVKVLEAFKANNWPYLVIDVATEFDATGLSLEERKDLGVAGEPELDVLIRKAYEILGLITFLTTGPDETRAWTVHKGDKAPKAAGAIHTDFEKGFIKAETINWKVLIDCNGYAGAREKGVLRSEGKEYIVQDGDVMEFKFNN